jgi:hypothetical protein
MTLIMNDIMSILINKYAISYIQMNNFLICKSYLIQGINFEGLNCEKNLFIKMI